MDCLVTHKAGFTFTNSELQAGLLPVLAELGVVISAADGTFLL